MQANKQTFLDFTRRTDTLASRLRVRLGDLPSKLGISRASLFSYRSGKSPISNKAWQKLTLAERESGIAAPFKEQLLSVPENQKRELIASASLEEILNILPLPERTRIATAALDAQIDSIQLNLIGFVRDAEALAHLVKTKGSKSELKFFAQKVSESVKSSGDMLEMLILQLRTAFGLDTRTLAERQSGSGERSKSQAANASPAPHRGKPSKKTRSGKQ